MNDALKVLIVDTDFKTRRALLSLLAALPGIDAAESVSSVESALAKLKYSPFDLVLLDAQIPQADGTDALDKLLQQGPENAVVIMSAKCADEADQVVGALQKGVMDYIPKPLLTSEASAGEFRLRLLTITGMIRNRKNMRRTHAPLPPGPEQPAAPFPGTRTRGTPPSPARPSDSASFALRSFKATQYLAAIDVVVIASSTGGPNALNDVIPGLAGGLGVPILLVQHMPAFMTASLAANLDARSTLQVKEAVDGEAILPNIVYLAPGGQHMVVRCQKGPGNRREFPKYLALNQDPPENSVRPSADVLFRSVAEAYETNILAVVMTGMGNDGMRGVEAMKRGGCYCLTQSMDTCVVYGMPRAVDEAGLSDEQVPLKDLADRVNALVLGQSPRRAKR